MKILFVSFAFSFFFCWCTDRGQRRWRRRRRLLQQLQNRCRTALRHRALMVSDGALHACPEISTASTILSSAPRKKNLNSPWYSLSLSLHLCVNVVHFYQLFFFLLGLGMVGLSAVLGFGVSNLKAISTLSQSLFRLFSSCPVVSWVHIFWGDESTCVARMMGPTVLFSSLHGYSRKYSCVRWRGDQTLCVA